MALTAREEQWVRDQMAREDARTTDEQLANDEANEMVSLEERLDRGEITPAEHDTESRLIRERYERRRREGRRGG